MDTLILSNISSLNLIKEEYDKLLEENKQLKQELHTLKRVKMKTPTDSAKIYNENTDTIEIISKEESYNYGSGIIRYKLDDKYYHGLGKLEERYAWYNRNDIWTDRVIVEYKADHCLHYSDWDTHSADSFCNNCSYDIDSSKRKKVLAVYKCNGHTI